MTSPAAQLRAMRPVKSYTCAHCGAGFQASDTRAKYCSNRCQQAAKYARQKSNDYLALDRLAASLVDDILRMTDEEILAEVAADGEDPKQIAQEAKGIFERAVTICGKSRLAAAKKAVLSDRQQGSKSSPT
jgi:predicted nucleic acid-binding Zn ribbon protein